MQTSIAHTDVDPTAFLDLYNRRIVADGAADMNAPIIADFRANSGPTGVFTGAPILLLTTTGAKSGQPRTAPVVYTREGDRYIVLASRAGAPLHPAWYHNVVANPTATVELGEQRFSVACSFPQGQQREQLLAQHLATLPDQLRELMQGYQQQTTRPFPVVVLERVS